jgi:hypothetical protein
MARVANLERRTFTRSTGASIVAIGIWSLAMLWLSLASGTRHDYNAYLSQWKLVLSVVNPWSTDNAYGPLHNLLAYEAAEEADVCDRSRAPDQLQ